VPLAPSSLNREAALLRATTELYIHAIQHDRDEIRRYEELVTHFLPRVPVTDRAYVAQSLATRADAPVSVLRQLARDLIEVAAPVLTHSEALTPLDLLSVIAATGPLHHRLIARRRDLPEDVARALRLTGDDEVIAALDAADDAEPAPVAKTPPTPSRPLRRPPRSGPVPFRPADRDEPEAAEVAVPADATPAEIAGARAARAFLGLDRDGRLALIRSLAGRQAPVPAPRSGARLQTALRAVYGAPAVVGFARKRQKDQLVDAIAVWLRLDPALVEAMIDDPSGEPLVLLLKAMGLSDSDARQILLLANPAVGRVVESFFRLADLHAGIETAVAEILVAAWRGEPVRPAAAGHQPHFAPAEERARPAAAAPQGQSRPAGVTFRWARED
jgi:hypothetical protein